MIDELDETLRQLLIRELPIKNGEIDIQFKQPTREWSARLSRPTLNLFLYDLRENTKLRQPSPYWMVESREGGKATQRRQPVRMDLHYVITAWANEPEDEHRMLARTLMALFRNPMLKEETLPEGLQDQPAAIQMLAAQPDALQNPADFWSSMDNDIRPAITCTVTVAINPYAPIVTPMVSERALTFRNLNTGAAEEPGPTLWTVNGTLRGYPTYRGMQLRLVERDLDIPVRTDGTFTISNVPQGEYTIEVQVDGETSTHTLTVPSPEYGLEG
ncbi:MAG: DUF4255 domain-containing protein [Anaerolineales bacterium]